MSLLPPSAHMPCPSGAKHNCALPRASDISVSFQPASKHSRLRKDRLMTRLLVVRSEGHAARTPVPRGFWWVGDVSSCGPPSGLPPEPPRSTPIVCSLFSSIFHGKATVAVKTRRIAPGPCCVTKPNIDLYTVCCEHIRDRMAFVPKINGNDTRLGINIFRLPFACDTSVT